MPPRIACSRFNHSQVESVLDSCGTCRRIHTPRPQPRMYSVQFEPDSVERLLIDAHLDACLSICVYMCVFRVFVSLDMRLYNLLYPALRVRSQLSDKQIKTKRRGWNETKKKNENLKRNGTTDEISIHCSRSIVKYVYFECRRSDGNVNTAANGHRENRLLIIETQEREVHNWHNINIFLISHRIFYDRVRVRLSSFTQIKLALCLW